ncbi:MAG: tetratricopeptide repeat protein [Phycisphaerae bacterium]|nr:tetratricopeptide repeat protein [Phycisphaerae bacterium]
MAHRHSPQPDAGAYSRGIALYKQGDYAGALDALDQAGDGELIGQMSRYYRGMCHRAMGVDALQAGELDAAETHLRDAAGALGRSADLASYLAAVYARCGQAGRCAGAAEQAAELNPDDPDAWRRLAQSQWQDGRRAEAMMTLTSAQRRLGECASLLLQEGLFAAATERFDAAEELLSRAAKLAPDWTETHYYGGLVAAAAGDPVHAAGYFQRALALRPGDMVLAHHLTVAASAARQQGREIQIRLPDSSPSQNRCEAQQLAQYVTKVPEFLDACLAMPPSEADAELLGMLSAVMRVALGEHPGFADLHHRFSRILARQGQLGEAIEHAEHAVGINGSYVAGLLHLGELYERTGRASEAVEMLERAIACGGDWADVHCRAGELHVRCGRGEAASEHFHRALALKKDYRRAVENLDALAA